MRLIKYKLSFIAFLILTVFNSCDKAFLDRNPPAELPVDQALDSEADLQVALRGAYAGLRNVDHYGRTFPVIGDVYADNAYVSVQNSGRYTQFNNYTVTVADGNVAGLWGSAYNTILRANNIINSNIASNPNVDQYKGEAYAVRALCYFNLVRWFARPYSDDPNGLGVPIVTSYNPDAKPARNTVAEVYNLMIADLTQAYTLMTKFTNSSQFSKYAAKALQAKVYLNMEDNANAKTAALDVINNSGFTPVSASGYVNYWDNSAIRTDKVETLMEVSSDEVGNLSFDALGYIYTQGGYGDLLCADDLYASYEAGDARLGLFTTGTRGGLPAIFIWKYPDISGDRSDSKVMRLSEVYLIAAEASLPTNEVDARMYLNFIRTRRNVTPSTATGAALFEEIIAERRKELAFEGDRYHDIQRLQRAVTRSNNYPSSARTIPYSDYRRVLPIPQGETDANANIRVQQNPGW